MLLAIRVVITFSLEATVQIDMSIAGFSHHDGFYIIYTIYLVLIIEVTLDN